MYAPIVSLTRATLFMIDHPSNVWLSGTEEERIERLHTAGMMCVFVCVIQYCIFHIAECATGNSGM